MPSDDRFRPGTFVSVPGRDDIGQIVVLAGDHGPMLSVHHPRPLRHEVFFRVYFPEVGDLVTYHWRALREVPDPGA